MFPALVRRSIRSIATATKLGESPSKTVIKAGVILKRPPLVLREPTAFEIAHYQYLQDVQNPRQRFPYRKDFFESAKNSSASNALQNEDGDGSAEEDALAKERQAEQEAAEAVKAKAQKDADRQSLERLLSRTVYLVVKKPRAEHAWQFPQGHVEAGESLREAAERELAEECGRNMNVWFVGNAPVAHHRYELPVESRSTAAEEDRGKDCAVFFLKSQIYAGRVDLGERKEVQEYAWLTKEELEQALDPAYFQSIQDALVE